MAELGFPVVATSGNLSDEPICTDEREALERLGGIADVFLVHNRPIVRHVDDSIVRVMLDRELVLRRARGYAPLPIQFGVQPTCGHSSTKVQNSSELRNRSGRRRASEKHRRARGRQSGFHQPAHRRSGNRAGARRLPPRHRRF